MMVVWGNSAQCYLRKYLFKTLHTQQVHSPWILPDCLQKQETRFWGGGTTVIWRPLQISFLPLSFHTPFFLIVVVPVSEYVCVCVCFTAAQNNWNSRWLTTQTHFLFALPLGDPEAAVWETTLLILLFTKTLNSTELIFIVTSPSLLFTASTPHWLTVSGDSL